MFLFWSHRFIFIIINGSMIEQLNKDKGRESEALSSFAHT